VSDNVLTTEKMIHPKTNSPQSNHVSDNVLTTEKMIVSRKNVNIKCSAHDAGISGIYFNKYARSRSKDLNRTKNRLRLPMPEVELP
jgi:hypothetical protein